MSYVYKLLQVYVPLAGADAIVAETSGLVKLIMTEVKKNDLKNAIWRFAKLAHHARTTTLSKYCIATSVKQASKYADANEYYLEALKEMSAVVDAMIREKYGNLVSASVMQEFVTAVSEEENLEKEFVEEFITKHLHTPRKKKVGKKNAGN